MAVVEKKLWPEFFTEVLRGKRRVEIRLADFEIKKGDTFVVREWDPKIKEYTGREVKFKVKKVIKIPEDLIGFYPLHLIKKHGLYVMDLER